jgi:hypothetical protein
MGEWTDRQKYWMETARTLALGIAGAAATVIILGNYADASRTKTDIKVKQIDQFLDAANKYTDIAYDFCNGDEKARDIFESTIVQQYNSSKRRLNIYFPYSLEDLINNSNNLARQLHSLCKSTHLPSRALLHLSDESASGRNSEDHQNERKTEWKILRDKLKETDDKIATAALDAVWEAFRPF